MLSEAVEQATIQKTNLTTFSKKDKIPRIFSKIQSDKI